jgi:MFS family permease
LDGIGLGILDALIALILADIMRGTGRYNVARGIVGTAQGVGGSLSNVVAGLIVVTFGYAVAFLTLAAVAVSAFIFMMAAMPETGAKPTRRLERSTEFPIPS